MSDISFSASEVAIITTMLGFVCIPVSVLYFSLRSSYLDRIADYREAWVDARRRNDELRPAIEKLTEIVRSQSALLERLVKPRERRLG